MRWSWDVERYDTGIPRETQTDRALRLLQPFLALAFALIAIVTVRPMGYAGAGLVRLLLILACTALLLTVPVPDRVVDLRLRFRIALLMAVLAGILIGIDGQGWGGTFAYMVGMHSAIRFHPRLAARVLVLLVGTAITCQAIWGGHNHTPWWTNLMIFLVLIPGTTRRARQLTLEAAHEVVEQTRRAAESEAAARALAERAAIAREIHDVLAHSLSGVNMQLSLADALFDSDQTERGRDAVRTAQRMVVTGLDEARAAVQTLRGDTIDPVEALERMLTGPGERIEIEGTPYPLPSRTVHALVRIAQESTTNARRHAPAAPLLLRLRYDDAGVVFTAANGPGTDSSTGEGSGMGLVGMRERATGVGGSLEAGPAPEGGWVVRFETPREDA